MKMFTMNPRAQLYWLFRYGRMDFISGEW